MFGAGLIDITTTAINIAVPLVLTDFVQHTSTKDNTEVDQEKNEHNYLVFIAASAFLVAQVLPKLRNMLVDSVRANVQKELTYAMVKKAYELELDHHLTERTGYFAQALSKNYSSIDKGMPSFFGTIVPFSLEVLAISGCLTYKFGPMGLTPLGVVSIYSLVAYYTEKKTGPIRAACVGESYKGYAAVIDAVNNYQVAHQFGNIGYELEKVHAALVRTETEFRKVHLNDDKNAFILSFINGAGFVGALALFLLCYPSNLENKVIDFALYSYLLTRINAHLDTIPSALSAFNTAIFSDGKKIAEFLDKKSLVSDSANARELCIDGPLKIEFRDVCFSYEQKSILNNISFVINPGDKFAIVGPTGCGKSTIVKLLQRFYRPDQGNILINNMDISEFTTESLRKHLSVVSQDSVLFNETLIDNIRYGDLSASDIEVREAAMLAGLIKHNEEEKLSQIVGQGGSKLSGGEKQRAGVARAFLKASNTYILDEPTSSLDVKTESEVQKTLDQISQMASVLLITHRLHTVANANKIIYIDQGTIIESGTFEELLEKRGKFYEQLKRQCDDLGIPITDIKPSLSQDSQDMDGSRKVSNFWQKIKTRRNGMLHRDRVNPIDDMQRLHDIESGRKGSYFFGQETKSRADEITSEEEGLTASHGSSHVFSVRL